MRDSKIRFCALWRMADAILVRQFALHRCVMSCWQAMPRCRRMGNPSLLSMHWLWWCSALRTLHSSGQVLSTRLSRLSLSLFVPLEYQLLSNRLLPYRMSRCPCRISAELAPTQSDECNNRRSHASVWLVLPDCFVVLWRCKARHWHCRGCIGQLATSPYWRLWAFLHPQNWWCCSFGAAWRWGREWTTDLSAQIVRYAVLPRNCGSRLLSRQDWGAQWLELVKSRRHLLFCRYCRKPLRMRSAMSSRGTHACRPCCWRRTTARLAQRWSAARVSVRAVCLCRQAPFPCPLQLRDCWSACSNASCTGAQDCSSSCRSASECCRSARTMPQLSAA